MLTIILTALALGYTAIVAGAWAVQEKILFPSYATGPATADPPAGVERWWVDQSTTEAGGSGRTEVWFSPSPHATAERPGPVVLYFHGNAELIEHRHWELARIYHPRGISLLLVEYRGYGNSDGTPGERTIVADALAALERTLEKPNVDADRVIYHGRSIGGGVAGALAMARPPAGLVLETTFTSIVAMAHRRFMPGFVVRHPFRTDRTLRDHFGGPVLVMHGDADPIIPVSHGRRLAQLAGDRGTYIEMNGVGHNDFGSDLDAYERAVGGWLDAEFPWTSVDAPPGLPTPDVDDAEATSSVDDEPDGGSVAAPGDPA